ncbi:hypothetical protein [Zhaonella formicivorans]|uniref:hypothetical protein n=1 Tax=Zhaonella formicivorans TaxID=2528593 RepID=UPI0010EDFF47|nr:hypothetical protein [Zhaonella formicivorans]
MIRKSKFATAIFSFIPGLGHFYLGLMNRGLTFILAFFGWLTFVVFFGVLTRKEEFLALLIVLPIVWFYSLFDAWKQCEAINRQETAEDRSIFSEFNDSLQEGKKSKGWALLFSAIPGAGHMYWGLKREGLQLMGAFFLSLFLLDWLHLSIFFFSLPVIWFYSFFDALQFKAEKEGQEEVATGQQLWPLGNPKYLGYLLIFVGCLIIFEKLISPFLDWQILELLKTGIIAFLFIAGGVKLLAGSKNPEV